MSTTDPVFSSTTMTDSPATFPPQKDTTTDTATFFPNTDSVTNTTNTRTDSENTTTSQPTPPPQILSNPSNTIHIELTHSPLSPPAATTYTRSPTAGANVLFLGTTRSYFLDPTRPVSKLVYSAYPALALRTLLKIATIIQSTHNLERIYVAHRLGEVGVAEESIIVAVSSAHRGAGWRGAEELLEKVKERAEIWKREWFVDGVVAEGRDGAEGEEVGVWRDNRESDAMGNRKGKKKEEGGV